MLTAAAAATARRAPAATAAAARGAFTGAPARWYKEAGVEAKVSELVWGGGCLMFFLSTRTHRSYPLFHHHHHTHTTLNSPTAPTPSSWTAAPS